MWLRTSREPTVVTFPGPSYLRKPMRRMLPGQPAECRWPEHATSRPRLQQRMRKARASWASGSLEASCFFRPLRCVARTIRVRTYACELAALDNQILVADRSTFKVTLEDLAGASSVSRLSRQTCA